MALYRMTVRYFDRGRQGYHVDDVEAATVTEAMRVGATRIPAEVSASADLVEVRLQADPDRREYTPG